jgi:hypothetical protein
MNLNDITVDGKVYTPVFDTDSEQDCNLCAFRDDGWRCQLANKIVNCCDTDSYFVPASTLTKVDLRSSTQQMQDWQPSVTMEEKQPVGTKYDQDKLQYSLIPSHALEQIAKNLTVGLKKYKERDNWKKVEGAEQRYLYASHGCSSG